MNLEHEALDSGYCSMAGAFGYWTPEFPTSLAIAQERLVPAVTEAAADDVVVAAGVSCPDQISDLSARRALTLAEVLAAPFQERRSL